MENLKKIELPDCYNKNDMAYPLCKGQEGKEECKLCNLYEDMGDSVQ